MHNVLHTGQVLYVRNYEACLDFYGKKLQLPVYFANEMLTCYECYGTYLMVEREDRPEYLHLPADQPRTFTCLRLNVADVKAAAEATAARGIDVDYQEHDWGTVAKFKDPDGNLIAFKDEAGFLQQIAEHCHKPERPKQ
ncbi:VOC family protein [Neolewinella agarilytica]|uniref:VOC family protein n=1 Tax=Neolewinella agarilytica TaxID=478744 RepID=UPI002352D990|nr:VOC family protein [Neolewinella agarilytica]